MRATGFPSFTFRVTAVVRSATNQVMVAAQHSGEVFGTDTPGDRQNNWDESATDPNNMKLIRNVWPDISGGTLAVSRSSGLGGALGTAVDLVQDIAPLFVLAETVGPGLAVCLVIGSEEPPMPESPYPDWVEWWGSASSPVRCLHVRTGRHHPRDHRRRRRWRCRRQHGEDPPVVRRRGPVRSSGLRGFA